MTQTPMKESDIAVLIAAIQNSVTPLQVDAEKVARQLGMSLSSIPPKFSGIRKKYNIDITVLNAGALRRKQGLSPRRRSSSTAEQNNQSLKGDVNLPESMINSQEQLMGSQSGQQRCHREHEAQQSPGHNGN